MMYVTLAARGQLALDRFFLTQKTGPNWAQTVLDLANLLGR